MKHEKYQQIEKLKIKKLELENQIKKLKQGTTKVKVLQYKY